MKKLIKYLLIITLVLVEGFLLISFVGGNIKEKKETEIFCDQKCAYSQNSYFWEFKGENIARGFTTKDECVNYCIKFKQGFVYSSIIDARNFLGALFQR
ncbi:hypothetical protein KKE19_04265 [Patescibacteria group bacterium]|nr:hypothetical protein [Patescibacteria group bacterium]MBU4274995.1 hypothetical protein [Patescibacteria group bacterium]MBU4367268.1 hypothetical protein [Patescibacteria group bacterium]MBU4462015.1 hypothetical protein [Patescibacteria group bacterium]MCG2700206.1 hypothetical protein [Candidatus Parcubacteria bacterium]